FPLPHNPPSGSIHQNSQMIPNSTAARACTVSDMADLGRNAEPPAIAANNTTYIRHFLQM
ncbi:hypothetical protein ACEY2D_011305, partial [Neisseria gonorrhoeae]